MTRPSKERNTKRNPTNTKAFSSSFHSEKWEIERLFIKILYVLDDNRRSQLVWKDEMQVNLRSENNRVWQILEDVWQIWTQKLIWAPMRPLLVKNHSTTSRSPTSFFSHRQINQKMPKLDLSVGRRLRSVKLGIEEKAPLMRLLLWF